MPVYAATIDVTVNHATPDAIPFCTTFTITISHTDFPQTGGATVGVIWNPDVLDLTSITTDTFLFGVFPDAPSEEEQAAGEIVLLTLLGSLIDPSLDPVGSFDSMILTFFAIAAGTSDIIIDESGAARGWDTSDAERITGIIYNQAMVNVVIPVPAAIWLFGSSLGLLGCVRRKSF